MSQVDSDVDAMMEAVRRDLRHAEGSKRPKTGTRVGPAAFEVVIERVREEVLRRRNGPSTGGSSKPTWRPLGTPVATKASYRLDELLVPSDRQFVETAYQAILRRPADEPGLEWMLQQLRDGELDKVEALARLRWSDEGKACDVHVDGLLVPTLLRKLRRKRFVGPVFSWLHAVLHLGRSQDRHSNQVALLAGEVQELGRFVNALSDRLEESEQRERRRQTEQLQRVEEEQRRADEAMHAYDQLYSDFEDAFRGGKDTVRERVMPYLEVVKSAGAGTAQAPVLDLGCGRGEWLELLGDHGLIGRGIDLNRRFLASCRDNGLDVVESDAIQALKTLPPESVGAVTSIHLVEHLPFEQLIELIDEALRVLRPGGVLIMETPNPENIDVATIGFYMDPTHRNPIPPQVLQWLASARGFHDVRLDRPMVGRRLSAPSLGVTAEQAKSDPALSLASRRLISPDYAVIAFRS